MKKASMKHESWLLKSLKPAEYNPRVRLTPEDEEYQFIKRSIENFGYADPIIINSDGTIIGGHQRYNVLVDLGYTEADVVVMDLDKNSEKALNVALNKITGRWDEDKLKDVLQNLTLSDFDATLTGFNNSELSQIIGAPDLDYLVAESGAGEEVGQLVELPVAHGKETQQENEPKEKDFFNRKQKDMDLKEDGNEEYNTFVEKFKPKKTTDDCYTPELVYKRVADWVSENFGVDKLNFARPFFPGGDFESFDYAGKIVVDNPPFSIISRICKFYQEKGIKFFLFAPSLTMLSGIRNVHCGLTYISAGASITYENGAKVNTSFVTNLFEDGPIFMTSPELYRILSDADKENLKDSKRTVPSYQYPDNVLSAAIAGKYAKYGVSLKIYPDDCVFVRGLDAQKEKGKEIYGGGLLLSERAAAERAAAERAAAERWSLGDRELKLIAGLKGDERTKCQM